MREKGEGPRFCRQEKTLRTHAARKTKATPAKRMVRSVPRGYLKGGGVSGLVGYASL